MDDSSLSSSSSNNDDHKHRKRCHHNDDNRKRKRRSKHPKGDLKKLPPAQSDWEALRSHFQFVLPDEDEQSPLSGAKKYGSTWQDRMVQHYHSHLYKEYVLADLSRVLEIGNVGLRWRTENEVKSGRGFRSCGNLKCESVASSISTSEKKAAYDAAVRRSVGIGVPENNGKEPIGVVLPLSTSSEAGEALDWYLKSCIHNKTTSGDEDSDSSEDRRSRKRHKKSKEKKKNKHHRKKHSRSSSSLHDEERDEQKRLSQVPYGVGLYDYEVDFAYVEHNVNKRELVKVRLCLRCAPLLFAAKDVISASSNNNQDDKIGPATKARNVRLKAMEVSRNSAKNADDDEKESVINVK